MYGIVYAVRFQCLSGRFLNSFSVAELTNSDGRWFQSFTTLTEKAFRRTRETARGLTSLQGCPLVSPASAVSKKIPGSRSRAPLSSWNTSIMSPRRRRWYKEGNFRARSLIGYGRCCSSGTSLVARRLTLSTSCWSARLNEPSIYCYREPYTQCGPDPPL